MVMSSFCPGSQRVLMGRSGIHRAWRCYAAADQLGGFLESVRARAIRAPSPTA